MVEFHAEMGMAMRNEGAGLRCVLPTMEAEQCELPFILVRMLNIMCVGWPAHEGHKQRATVPTWPPFLHPIIQALLCTILAILA
eukprot:1139978-Pelagomonas_calceolata.AAC.1